MRRHARLAARPARPPRRPVFLLWAATRSGRTVTAARPGPSGTGRRRDWDSNPGDRRPGSSRSCGDSGSGWRRGSASDPRGRLRTLPEFKSGGLPDGGGGGRGCVRRPDVSSDWAAAGRGRPRSTHHTLSQCLTTSARRAGPLPVPADLRYGGWRRTSPRATWSRCLPEPATISGVAGSAARNCTQHRPQTLGVMFSPPKCSSRHSGQMP